MISKKKNFISSDKAFLVRWNFRLFGKRQKRVLLFSRVCIVASHVFVEIYANRKDHLIPVWHKCIHTYIYGMAIVYSLMGFELDWIYPANVLKMHFSFFHWKLFIFELASSSLQTNNCYIFTRLIYRNSWPLGHFTQQQVRNRNCLIAYISIAPTALEDVTDSALIV